LLTRLIEALTNNLQRISERVDGPDSGPKLEEIPIYHGKNLGEWRTWTADAEDRHAQYPRKYSTEESRVRHGVSRCDDKIKLAWRIRIDYRDPSEPDPTWEELKRYLKTWADPEADRMQQAAFRLLNERQGTRQVRDWGARCLEIWEFLENPVFRVQLFIETLNDDLQRELTRTPDKFSSITDVIEVATRYQSILHRERIRAKRQPSRVEATGPPTGSRSNGGLNKRKREEEDEPEATRRPGQRESSNPTANKARKGNEGSQGQRDRRREKQRKEKRCFECNEVGHFVSECPKRAGLSQPRGAQAGSGIPFRPRSDPPLKDSSREQ
jgi:hypothetical protein